MSNPSSTIRTTYLYLAAFIGLIVMVVGVRDLVNFVLEIVIPSAQATGEGLRYYGALRNGLASVIVGSPVWWYHWKLIRAEHGPTEKPSA